MIIDVSRHQGIIDWNKVQKEGDVDYAIIRCTMGSVGVDDKFAINWANSISIPKRGQYHYIITTSGAQSQLENIKRITGEDFGNQKFTVDVERTESERKAIQAGWVFPKIMYTNMLHDLCYKLKEIVPQGIRIYSNKYEWEAVTTQPAWAKEFEFHVAGYPFDPNSTTYKPAVPLPWMDWKLWQYSSTGKIPGILANVDLDKEKILIPQPNNWWENKVLPFIIPPQNKKIEMLKSDGSSYEPERVLNVVWEMKVDKIKDHLLRVYLDNTGMEYWVRTSDIIILP